MKSYSICIRNGKWIQKLVPLMTQPLILPYTCDECGLCAEQIRVQSFFITEYIL